jgi:hypothetical protein
VRSVAQLGVEVLRQAVMLGNQTVGGLAAAAVTE